MDWNLQKKLRQKIHIESYFEYENQKIFYTISSENGLVFNSDEVNKYHRNFYIKNEKEKMIFCQYWLVDCEKPTVFFHHGNAENSSSHPQFIFHLIKQGFNVLLLDQEGFGNSDGIRGGLDDFEDYLKNVDLVIKHYDKQLSFLLKGSQSISKNKKTPKYYFIGFSMGGFIIAYYYFLYKSDIRTKINIDKIILLAPWLNNHPRLVNKFQKFILLNFTPFFKKEDIKREKSQYDVLNGNEELYLNMYKNLSDNKAFLKRRFKDKRIHRLISNRWIGQITKKQQELYKYIKKSKIDAKDFYIFINSKDVVVDNNFTKIISDKIISCKLFQQDNYYHDFLDYSDYRWEEFRRNFDRILFDKYSE